MHRVSVSGSNFLHNVSPNVNILLNKHKFRHSKIHKESRCSECGEFWPCSVRIVIEGYSEAIQKLVKLGEEL